MSKIGFVILSHNNPQQLYRLVRCLQRVYDNPPIAIHHDFGQSEFDQSDFPSEARFVVPHVATRWGKFSLIAAALRALDLLYRQAAPDWFFLLSATDYPVMAAEKVREELSSDTFDALLDYREVPSSSNPRHKLRYRLLIGPYSASLAESRFEPPYPVPANPALRHFVLPQNLELAWRRYVAATLWFPVVRRGPQLGRYKIYLPFDDRRAPFRSGFKCYYGDQWFAGNQKTAQILLNPTDSHIQLRRHLRRRNDVSDECYYQTVLVNTPGLRISADTRRFVDWTESAGGQHGGDHPKVVRMDDLPAILSSRSYFARKFSPESPMLDTIDNMLMRHNSLHVG